MAKIGINIATGSLQKEEMVAGIDPDSTNSLVAAIHAKDDIKTRALVEAITAGEQLLQATEEFLTKNTAVVSQEELIHTGRAIQSLQLALTMEDKELVYTKMEELNEITRPFAERAMDMEINRSE